MLRSMPRDGDRYAKKPLSKDDRQGDFYGESRVLVAERVVLPVLTGHSVEDCPTRTPVAGRVTYQRSANHRGSTLSKKIGTVCHVPSCPIASDLPPARSLDEA